jgi:DNA-binding beta-propeller fold protein YncE
MLFLRSLRHATALLAAAAASGCADPDPIIENRYSPYGGDAYPNQRPTIAIPEGGMGIVSDSLGDTLSFLSLATGDRFHVGPVGRDPVTIDGPHHVGVDPAAGAVYVALSYPAIAGATGPHATHGSSVASGYVQKLALDDLRVLGQVRVDSNPGDIVVSQDGNRVVVSHFDLKRILDNPRNPEAARSALAVIDAQSVGPSGSPEPVRIPLCMAAHGIALTRPDAATAYVACYGEDALAIVDLTRPDAPPKLVPVGPGATVANPSYGPYVAMLSPDQKTLAVSNTVSKDVRFFDVESGTFDEARTIRLRGAPYFGAWTPDGRRLYVPTQSPDTISLFDLTQGNAEIVSRDLGGECDKPHVVDYDGGDALFLVCEGDQTRTPGEVLKLDPGTLATMTRTRVGLYPDAFVRVAGGAP